MSLSVIILAAGRGTRMRGPLPKVLHEVAGYSMLEHVVIASKALGTDDIRIVVGPELLHNPTLTTLKHQYQCSLALQQERRGTADALLHGIGNQPLHDKTLVLYGDTPLLTGETLRAMVDRMAKDKSAKILCLGFEATNPHGYGRLITHKDQQLVDIIEEREASKTQQSITLCNSGIMLFASNTLPSLLKDIGNNNASGEYYLTDIVRIATQRKIRCIYELANENDVRGVNTYTQLVDVEALMQSRMRGHLIEQGVIMPAPDTVFLSADTKIEAGATIHPYVVIGKEVQIATGTTIYPFSHIESSTIGANCMIGPYARLRNHNRIEANVRIGNFVELKQAIVGENSKAAHLCYIGDADLEANVNIGAGTIFCNYDGFNKHHIHVGEGTFIGSNSCLVAPVTIGPAALVAAGSTITDDLAEDEMGIARTKQATIPKRGMKTRRKRHKSASSNK